MWPALLRVQEILKYRAVNEVQVEEKIDDHFKNLPVETHCARRSTSFMALNDNIEGVPHFFGWFTYILNEDNVAAAARNAYFEEKLSGYTTQHDNEGKPSNRPTLLFEYQVQEDLQLYNMSQPKTILYLQQQLSHTDFLDAAFSIIDGQVYRNSELNTDRKLFIQLVNEELVNDEVQGWLHDDITRLEGGIHRREAVILNPRDFLLPPVEENDGYLTP